MSRVSQLIRSTKVPAFGAALLTITCTTGAVAQFPTKPVRFVTATPVGGAADIIARRIADPLSRGWGQAVIVQARPGAGGSAAALTVIDATPDGHTLLFAAHPILAINPVLYKKLPFDPYQQLLPVVLATKMPHVLLVNPASPWANVKDLIAAAKARPGILNFGSGPPGTSIHLAGELLQELAGIELNHVPYRGSAPVAVALMGEEIDLAFDATATALGHIRNERLRGLAIASSNRIPALPDLPTFIESGLPDFESSIAHGLVAPTGTEASVIDRINKAVAEIIHEADFRKLIDEYGGEVIGGSAREFEGFLAAERKKWASIIKKRQLTAD